MEDKKEENFKTFFINMMKELLAKSIGLSVCVAVSSLVIVGWANLILYLFEKFPTLQTDIHCMGLLVVGYVLIKSMFGISSMMDKRFGKE